jgi:4-hydroxy-3-methylbut-2-en-1-yl diphosphate reductase
MTVSAAPPLNREKAPETGRSRRPIAVLLAAPRGFCAGVERAILIVEAALAKWGPPVYVRHEIVHNRHVVERLQRLGAVFVEELDQCPTDRPVVFSAHGVPKSVPAAARAREMVYVDATCPLVSKVHGDAERHFKAGRQIILIGHAGHPEVIGTIGQLPEDAITLVENVADVERLPAFADAELAYVTQTTLSVDDTAEVVAALKRRFPAIAGPHKEDICYATTNRQDAVKALAARAQLVLVIGATNSSNSVRLMEVAQRTGAREAHLIASVEDVDFSWFDGVDAVGITAGASAPENLVEDLIAAIQARFDASVEEVRVVDEHVTFKLPRILAG